MRFLFLLLLVLISGTGIFAQKSTPVIVKAGNNIMDVLPTADVFYYPHFTNGTVFLRDGTGVATKLNYNRLVDEMHFINGKGDTLALANERDIKYIVIGNNTFYYDQGFLRVLAAGNLVKLAIKQVWIISDTRQVGAYNSTNNSVSMTSFTSYNEGGRLYDLIVNEDVILKKAENYYFGDTNNHFLLAGKKNLQMLFPKEQRRIEMYLKENKVNFNKMEDLQKIVQFLDTL